MKNINRNQGFTFLELMITILIMVIISAVAIPSLNGFFADMKLNIAGEGIATAIWYAQNLAVKEEKMHQVIFSTVANGNDLMVQREEGGIWSTVLNPFNKKDYIVDFDTDRDVKGVNITDADFGGTTSVIFGSDIEDPGRPSDCGDVIIEYGGNKRVITVGHITGKVMAGDLIETGSVISDTGNSTTQFKTNLTKTTNGYFNGYTIIITSNNDCYIREIADYDGTNRIITVDYDYPLSTPRGGDGFEIVGF
ncbi:MAG: prepilin-type N-terminal cleavage/methylation domain-containing protein [Nitrospinae bacterium]|nr:prepilin-type N-terminal cleavage/methylation domain-containing protein [Nitrospinota bacterium]